MRNTILGVLLLTGIAFSCRQPAAENPAQQNSGDKTVVEGIKSTTTSTNVVKLGSLLDFSKYKPDSVKFKYVLYDNSGKNERITVPGPSDSYLEALMYFNPETMKDLLYINANMDYLNPNLPTKEEFAFDWLPKEIADQLMNSEPDHRGFPDAFFGTYGGKIWFLRNAVLLTHSIN